MSGTGGSFDPKEWGVGAQVGSVDLNGVGNGVFVLTGAQVTVPQTGTYMFDVTVRSHIGTMNTGEGGWVVARLRDMNANVVVPNSEILAVHISHAAGGSTTLLIWNVTSPINVPYAVTGPTTVRLEAARFTGSGTTDSAAIHSDTNGRTTIRYRQVV